jgi:hypothetical protein
MAKARGRETRNGKGQNILVVGKNGRVAIASATGDLTITSATSILSDDIAALIQERQRAGKKLSDAFAKAKFAVTGSSELMVIDPSGTLTKLIKKKKKKAR